MSGLEQKAEFIKMQFGAFYMEVLDDEKLIENLEFVIHFLDFMIKEIKRKQEKVKPK